MGIPKEIYHKGLEAIPAGILDPAHVAARHEKQATEALWRTPSN